MPRTELDITSLIEMPRTELDITSLIEMPRTELDIVLENLTKEEIDILQRNSNERPFIELLASISSGKSNTMVSVTQISNLQR